MLELHKERISESIRAAEASISTYTVELISSGRSPYFTRSMRDKFFDFFFAFSQGAAYRFLRLHRAKERPVEDFLKDTLARVRPLQSYNDYPPISGKVFELYSACDGVTSIGTLERHTIQEQLDMVITKIYPRHVFKQVNPSLGYFCGAGPDILLAKIDSLQQLLFCHQILGRKRKIVEIEVPHSRLYAGSSVDFQVSARFFSFFDAALLPSLFCIIVDSKMGLVGFGSENVQAGIGIEHVYERALMSLHSYRQNQSTAHECTHAISDIEHLFNKHIFALSKEVLSPPKIPLHEYVLQCEQMNLMSISEYVEQLERMMLQEDIQPIRLYKTTRAYRRYVCVYSFDVESSILSQRSV